MQYHAKGDDTELNHPAINEAGERLIPLESPHLRIRIDVASDPGIVIDEEKLKQAFDKFYEGLGALAQQFRVDYLALIASDQKVDLDG